MMIAAWRKKAENRFLEIGGLAPNQEAFQYIPFSHLALPPNAPSPTPFSIEPYRLAEFEHCLVFIDGYFSQELSRFPQEMICLPLDAAFQSYGAFLQNRWTRLVQEEVDPLSALNAATHGKGAFVYVPANTSVRLHILHVLTSDALSSPRLEITLGKGAEVTLAETFASDSQNPCSNLAMDITLLEGSILRFFDMQVWKQPARSFGSVRATLKRDARFEALTMTSGAALVRSRFAVELAEENSSLSLQGLAMLKGRSEAHVHVFVDHAALSTSSHQQFKMALAEESTSSFDGKIFVRPIAQKTKAYQLNNNLHLSDLARSNSKPNLEIFADDVKASHGSTVAQVSEEELFYLRSRGLSPSQAKFLLASGFCQELIEKVDTDSLRLRLNDVMQQVLYHAL